MSAGCGEDRTACQYSAASLTRKRNLSVQVHTGISIQYQHQNSKNIEQSKHKEQRKILTPSYSITLSYKAGFILAKCWHFLSQWPRGLRPLAYWDCEFESHRGHRCLSVVLSGRGLLDEVISRSEGSYRLWCVVLCDQETSKMRRPWPTLGCSAKENKQNKQLTS